MNRKPIPYLSSIIGIVWLSFIILGYIITHFTMQTSIFLHLWTILVVLTFVALAGGIGSKFFPPINLPALTLSIIQVLIGFGILSLFTLFLGLFWKINNTIIMVKLVIGILIFSKSILQWLKFTFDSIKSAITDQSVFEKIIKSYLLLIFIIQLFQSFAPPVKYDALIYHLTLPKIYLQQEKISDIPWLVMSGMPQTSEMLYLDVMSVAGETAPLVLNWSFGLLTALGLYGFIKERVNPKSALIGVASLFSGYTIVASLSWAYVDWTACMFGMGMVVCLNQFLREKSGSNIFLSGLFAGLAFSTKYPAGVLFLCGFLFLSIYIWISKIRYFKHIWQYFLGAAIFAFPWLIKNLVFTGNPIYPFFFASGAMDATRIAVYQGALPYGNLLDLFLLPIRATIQGIDGTNGYSVSIGPLFLALSILVLLGWEKINPVEKVEIKFWGTFALTGISVWAIGNQLSGFMIQTRFYYALFPAFSILAAYGYSNLEKNLENRKGMITLSHSIIVLILLLNFIQISKDLVKKGTLPYIFTFENRQTYLENNMGWYALAMNEMANLPPESKIISIFEPRGYECVPKCDPDEILDHWKIAHSKNADFQSIQFAWVKAGYTHVFVYQQGIDFLKSNPDPHHPVEELEELDSFLSTMEIINDYDGIYRLYKILN